MNPLDSGHHLRIDQWCQYREGVVLNRTVKEGKGSWVNIGLYKECKIDQPLPEKTRVTVKLNETKFDNKLKFYTGKAVSINEPKEELGTYWGYSVRIVDKFKEIFDNSIYNEKFDLLIGTSDKGQLYTEANFKPYKDFKHCLIIFGGLQGIEGMVEHDEKFNLKIEEIDSIFDLYLNTCPNQGCRTIRTEEAMLVSLAAICPKLDRLKVVK